MYTYVPVKLINRLGIQQFILTSSYIKFIAKGRDTHKYFFPIWFFSVKLYKKQFKMSMFYTYNYGVNGEM